jgi:hypothetical protein
MRMRTASTLVLLPLILPVSTPALAVHNDSQIWTTAAVNVKLSDKWRLSNELTGRFSDNRNGLYDLEDDLLLGYQLSKKVGIWAGYVHDPQYSGGDFTIMEHRFREQVTFAKIAQIAAGSIDARLRIEQRWRNGKEGTGWRFRPFVKYSHPFKAGGKTALVISHEGFWNFNITSFQAKGGFERMRNLIAISTPITKNLNAEIGYLNQFTVVRGGPDTMDHIVSINLSLSP